MLLAEDDAMDFPGYFAPYYFTDSALRGCLRVKRYNNMSFAIQPILQCPSCGSDNVRPKGYVHTKTLGIIRLLNCKACGYRFRERTAKGLRHIIPPPNLVEKYFEAGSIKSLKKMLNLECSEKTLHRWLTNQLKKHITWEDFLLESAERLDLSHVMGLDTTVIPIAGKRHYYLHVADFPKNHIAFDILKAEDAGSIKKVLEKIKTLLGYMPAVTVMDLAQELRCAVKDVYPTTIIQGCLFHLRNWLNKRLPTKNLNNPIKAQVWEYTKHLIMMTALARDHEEREKYLNELKRLSFQSKEERMKRVIMDFLRNSKFYHPLKELMILGCRPEWRFNNVCERAIRTVVDLSRKMYGFKNLELTRKYINAMWIASMKARIKDDSHNKLKKDNALVYTLPLTLFTYDKYVDLEESARAHNVKIELLKSEVERIGYVVSGNIALSRNYLDVIRRKVLIKQPKTLQDFMEITNLGYQHSIDVINAIGLKIVHSSLDPREILLRYDSLVTNEKDNL